MKLLHWQDGDLVGEFDLDLVIETLNGGGIMAYPTDTLYGLGVDARSSTAIAQINALKDRQKSPISVMLGSVEWLLDVSRNLTDSAIMLIRTFLPGPLTIICESDLSVADELRSEKGTLGFRVPDHPFCAHTSNGFGAGITSTSVNPSGADPARSLDEIMAYYGGDLDMIIADDPMPDSTGSTVVDLSVSPAHILRAGVITEQQIQEVLL